MEVAEDGGREYIIPMDKEAIAVPLLRQMMAELSGEARKAVLGPLSGSDSMLSEGDENARFAFPDFSSGAGSIFPDSAGDPIPTSRGLSLHFARKYPDASAASSSSLPDLFSQALSSADPSADPSDWGGLLSVLRSTLSGAPQATGLTLHQTTNNSVQAPVNITVTASGSDAAALGQSVYDTAERYLLRTLKNVYS